MSAWIDGNYFCQPMLTNPDNTSSFVALVYNSHKNQFESRVCVVLPLTRDPKAYFPSTHRNPGRRRRGKRGGRRTKPQKDASIAISEDEAMRYSET